MERGQDKQNVDQDIWRITADETEGRSLEREAM